MSRLGNLHHPSETKELLKVPSQSAGALTRAPKTLASFNGVSEAWSLCSLLQANKALFHIKPRASPTAIELTVNKTLLEGSADLKIFT